LAKDLTIRFVTAPYFLATKIEAFEGRGQSDFLSSHDLEDIVAVIDGRPEIIEEVRAADKLLRTYLAKKFSSMLKNTEFQAVLPGHLNYGSLSNERAEIVMDRIKNLINEGV
jgi:hypothetical protein